MVEVVHGADEGRDQPRPVEVREGAAAEPVMGVVQVEAAVLGQAEPVPIISDALLHHVVGRAALDAAGRDRDRAAGGGAEEAAPRRIGRVDDRLVAERVVPPVGDAQPMPRLDAADPRRRDPPPRETRQHGRCVARRDAEQVAVAREAREPAEGVGALRPRHGAEVDRAPDA